MTPELALFLVGVTYVAEWLYRLYRLVRPNAGPVFV